MLSSALSNAPGAWCDIKTDVEFPGLPPPPLDYSCSHDDGSDAAVSSPPQPPIKKQRVDGGAATIDLVGCCMCLDKVAVPPTLLSCGHELCGPCVVDLEAPRKPRSAGFACPLCRAKVRYYSVSVHSRQQALAVASDEQRAADAKFMAEHMSQTVEVQAAAIKASRVSRVDAEQALAITARILARIPRTLIPHWTHVGDEFQFRLDNVFVHAVGADQETERATFKSARNRIQRIMQRGGVTMRRGGVGLVLRIPIESIERFSTMVWG